MKTPLLVLFPILILAGCESHHYDSGSHEFGYTYDLTAPPYPTIEVTASQGGIHWSQTVPPPDIAVTTTNSVFVPDIPAQDFVSGVTYPRPAAGSIAASTPSSTPTTFVPLPAAVNEPAGTTTTTVTPTVVISPDPTIPIVTPPIAPVVAVAVDNGSAGTTNLVVTNNFGSTNLFTTNSATVAPNSLITEPAGATKSNFVAQPPVSQPRTDVVPNFPPPAGLTPTNVPPPQPVPPASQQQAPAAPPAPAAPSAPPAPPAPSAPPGQAVQ
jgi:hypothetical protein